MGEKVRKRHRGTTTTERGRKGGRSLLESSSGCVERVVEERERRREIRG